MYEVLFERGVRTNRYCYQELLTSCEVQHSLHNVGWDDLLMMDELCYNKFDLGISEHFLVFREQLTILQNR